MGIRIKLRACHSLFCLKNWCDVGYVFPYLVLHSRAVCSPFELSPLNFNQFINWSLVFFASWLFSMVISGSSTSVINSSSSSSSGKLKNNIIRLGYKLGQVESLYKVSKRILGASVLVLVAEELGTN